MKEIVFLLEEPSARAFIEGLLPRLGITGIPCRYIVFDGKQDLEKQIVRKLRGYRNTEASFIVLRDQDAGVCKTIKSFLALKCKEAGKENAIVRIACRELESWYLADLAAVEKAFGVKGLSIKQLGKKFRQPDALGSPSKELRCLVPDYQKIQGSRSIAPYIDIDNTRSKSFTHFIRSLRLIVGSDYQ